MNANNPENATRKLVTLPHDLLRAVADFRFAHRINTESEALRVLIRAGLDAQSQPAEAKPARRKVA
jgi:metal-responsive CopG/Arc/MetJ family transcriptional regulator